MRQPPLKRTKEGTVAEKRSENRQLSKLVAVRLAPEDWDALREEAARREMSVPQLLREGALSSLRTAS
jgi:hypothetical protein